MPGGLMGHDFHGLVNQEALFEFAIKNNVSAVWERREATPAENNLLAQFIEQHAYWKNLARERFKNGEFPVYMEESKYSQTHGGLIFRPVDKRENYIKRCVGTPGDILEIKNSVLYVNGKRAYVSPGQALLYRIEKTKVSFPSVPEMLTRYGLENSADGARTDFDAFNDPKYYVLNLTKQEKQKIEQDFRIRLEKVRYPQWSAKEALKATPLQKIANLDQFPKDFNVNNTMTDFQRFQIPRKGQRIAINTKNIAWYKRIISAYEGHQLAIKGDKIYIDGKLATHYRFAMNYYWMMGDNRFHSADSRVWGFVPEDHIVGRASFVWFSKSPFVDSFLGIRFDRIFCIVD
jgi:signal peptidase I